MAVMDYGIVNGLEGSLFKLPPGARPCLGTQSHYKAPSDLCV